MLAQAHAAGEDVARDQQIAFDAYHAGCVQDQPVRVALVADELDRLGFERLLGPVMEILRRNAENYALHVNQ